MDDKPVYFANIKREPSVIEQMKSEVGDPSVHTPVPISMMDPNTVGIQGMRTHRRYMEPYGISLIKNELSSLAVWFNERRNTRSSTKLKESPFVSVYKNYLVQLPEPRLGEVWPSKLAPPKQLKEVEVEKKIDKPSLRLTLKKNENDTYECVELVFQSPALSKLCNLKKEKVSEECESNHSLLPEHKIKKEVPTDSESSQSESEVEIASQVLKQKTKERHQHLVPNLIEELKSDYISDIELEPTKTEPTRNTKNPQSALNTVKFPEAFHYCDEKVTESKDKITPLDPKPGPSTRVDTPDIGSDHETFENYTDSDSDPAWMPGTKSKATDTAKAFTAPARKRGPRGRRRGGNSTPRKRKSSPKSQEEEDADSPKKKRQAKPKAAPKKPAPEPARIGWRTSADRFLIAKEDINQPTPFIWKVDRKTSMLQRFEVSDQNGVRLHRSTFTYAAGNQFSVSKYITADVKVLSPDTVQYLGPNLSETAELALSEMKPGNAGLKEESFEHLKEDFIVYIQSLLSQDVDSTFLHEIKKFNDEYFLIPIQILEGISDSKKGKVTKEFWDEEFKKGIDTYPHVNILDSAIEGIKCQSCKRTQGDKLLQFYGQAYDRVTLETSSSSNSTANQFTVCDNCSKCVSFYSRLHHQKYNLFVECHSKASEVKSNNEGAQSHEDVLKLCLEDFVWIDKIFSEQVRLWKDSEKNS